MSRTDQDTMVPLSQAALQLGISWQRAWRLVLTGGLDGQKIGGRWLVSTTSVAIQLRQQTPAVRNAGSWPGTRQTRHERHRA